MRIALMQPYFFPYLGYFQLIHSVDEFVIFDNAQYTRRSWINRNRLLSEHGKSIYFNVPVCKAPRETKINDIVINNNLNWQEKILNQLIFYKHAPYFMNVMEFVTDCLTNSNSNLSQFITLILRKTCALLSIETSITILSQKFPTIIEANAADEWGIKVSRALNATTYINAIGGKDFYNQQKYIDNDLDIQFIQPILTPYKQYSDDFMPGLSIIDVLMFNDISKIKEMLDIHELV
ncbi:WbqC family protein [Lysinibacillus xylanilyticus]|uniref:WbqC family protein n=1 Tax=Lysinibacillus xylanilyticus TaxID=582475 RepID=UPI002B24ED08|nr:WbqC family protein [Lysinibacillus xylanilyticus]